MKSFAAHDSIEPIRVLIVDDHPILRHGLNSLLSHHTTIKVVGSVDRGALVIPFIENTPVDVILLDIKMEGQTGIEIARMVKRKHPGIKIIILTTYNDQNMVHTALEAGVHGYLHKSVSHEILPASIEAVMKGEKVLSADLISPLITSYQMMTQEQSRLESKLDSEEIDILSAVAKGASTKDLSDRFFWSETTVKRKVKTILEKIGAANRVEAVAIAIRKGWI